MSRRIYLLIMGGYSLAVLLAFTGYVYSAAGLLMALGVLGLLRMGRKP